MAWPSDAWSPVANTPPPAFMKSAIFFTSVAGRLPPSKPNIQISS
jgi:hypothetical protein